jgi:hypothetical protein
MTEAELMEKIKAIGLPEGDERIKGIVCQLIGHSRIVTRCFGYVHCARCENQIGDSLGGYWNGENAVVVGHNCETCRTNYEKMGWQDKLFCPDPFEEPMFEDSEESEGESK